MFLPSRVTNTTVSTCIKTTLMITMHQELSLNARCRMEVDKENVVGEKRIMYQYQIHNPSSVQTESTPRNPLISSLFYTVLFFPLDIKITS